MKMGEETVVVDIESLEKFSSIKKLSMTKVSSSATLLEDSISKVEETGFTKVADIPHIVSNVRSAFNSSRTRDLGSVTTLFVLICLCLFHPLPLLSSPPSFHPLPQSHFHYTTNSN
jgi:hypothetical protein